MQNSSTLPTCAKLGNDLLSTGILSKYYDLYKALTHDLNISKRY